MAIKSIALLGAGAVGSYFIAGLLPKFKDNFFVVAEGERKSRIERDGFVINNTKYFPKVVTPAQAHGADLLLVALKYNSLKSALPQIEQITSDNTIVMSLMNGVDSEDIIASKIGHSHLIYSMIKIAAERKDNSIVYDPEITQGVFFGEKVNGQKTAAVAKAFENTSVRCHVRNDIITDIWYKFALNISKNLPQAIIGCGYGAYFDSEYVDRLNQLLHSEVVAVAAAKGIDITDDTSSTGNSSYTAKTSRFSTLQDLDNHRHTEIDMFSGTLIRLGRELGIPTPYNEFAYNIIKALEEKNDGKFNY
ncbi:MAG: ketopantoate reductase family protein [Lachnospiraceae bacterium]